MSIINEALKKTEQSIHKNSNQEVSGGRKKITSKPYLIYILILIIGLFLSNFVFTLINRKTKTMANLTKKLSSLGQPAKEIKTVSLISVVAPEPMLKENKVSEENFVLNGIFFSDNDSYALVNNQIVRENDPVGRAKVKTITANSVELDNAGTTITLTTQR